MSVLYKNVDLSNYYLEMPSRVMNKEYSLEFVTDKEALPASNYEAFGNSSNLMYYGTVDGTAAGIIITAPNGLFVNKEAIALPSEIGGAVEGSLDFISYSEY